MMKTFHGDPALKQKYIERLELHYKADEIIKGIYWEKGKGCAVGCTVHSSNHQAYEDELGIPQVIAQLEDGIFEELPNEIAKEFPLRFLRAIPVGADLSKVLPQFMLWLLIDDEYGVIKYAKGPEITAIRSVASLYQRKINGEHIDINEWLMARNAADAASNAADADAASNAADAAADAANAAFAAYAAYAAFAAAFAAYAAANAAYAAAADADAARKVARIAQADKLIELLGSCK